jgi:hypothetical protein
LGWYQSGPEIYLTADFLNDFLLDEEIPVCDLAARRQGQGPDHDPVIAYPSFLKKLDIPVILDIWQQADAGLRQADEIEVWGYSLPESDSAMRGLLNPLRVRLQQRRVKIPVHLAGDGKALDRWRSFLPGVCVDHAKLG